MKKKIKTHNPGEKKRRFKRSLTRFNEMKRNKVTKLV